MPAPAIHHRRPALRRHLFRIARRLVVQQLQPRVGWFFQVCSVTSLHGRPPHLALFVEQGLCRLRWLAAALVPLWLVTLTLHQTYAVRHFTPAARFLGLDGPYGDRLLVALPIAVGLCGLAILLLLPRFPASIDQARRTMLLGTATALACEGMQLGFAPAAEAQQMSSFVFLCLVMFALIPLKVTQQLLLLAWALVIPVACAVWGGMPAGRVPSFIAQLSLPLAAIVLGVLSHYWNLRNFRVRTLAELKLQRRTRELEVQRAEAERQHQLAEARHAEAYIHRERAMQLLASALTQPVARAYEREGEIKPFTQTVVVIFCDAVKFSDVCRNLQPARIVSEMQRLWVEFDKACMDLGVEPLRAEGDARMAVAGLSFGGQEESTHRAAIAATLAMLRFRRVLPEPGEGGRDPALTLWPMRIGIHIGPVTAGVIDTNTSDVELLGEPAPDHYGRLWFDVWGDTVIIAARLAQRATPNQILVRERLLWELGGLFDYGPIHGGQVKNNVLPDCSEILGIHPDYCGPDGEPNAAFWEVARCDDYRPTPPRKEGSRAPAP